MGRRAIAAGLLGLLLTVAGAAPSAAVPLHPRLMINAGDLSRLRTWATPTNPVWELGLKGRLARADHDFAIGQVPAEDTGGNYDSVKVEEYAMLWAFASLVHPSSAQRSIYGKRARDMLMQPINAAALGPADGVRWRDPGFSIDDRSRYAGQAWGLTVDWAYQYFSAADKAKIRTVFLRWSNEQFEGYPLYNLPQPKPSAGRPINDPELLTSVVNRRYSLNNYYTAHARNMAFMAIALDPADDAGGALRRYLDDALGQFLFVADSSLRLDVAGGLGPEGFEYSPQTIAYLTQMLQGIRTAGVADTARYGAYVSMALNPFYKAAVAALLASLPAKQTTFSLDNPTHQGLTWQPAWYGGSEHYWMPDPTSMLAPLAMDATSRGDSATANAVRWMARHFGPGGEPDFLSRLDGQGDKFVPVLAFLLFDPAVAVSDPRPSQPLSFWAPGMARQIARSCWCEDARVFSWGLSWNGIDHQRGDGNDFGFSRRGEWLTKQRSAYKEEFTDRHNTLTVQNAAIDRDGYRKRISETGGQWILGLSDGDPSVVARSEGNGFVQATGDATNLYNTDYEDVYDVSHVSRSIVWLNPDRIIIYDRASTHTVNRFKRFWLQLPARPDVAGLNAIVHSPGGQQLFVSTLQPVDAVMTRDRVHEGTEYNDPENDNHSSEDTMMWRLRVEVPARPKVVRFLHVLQGADAGADRSPSTRIVSSAGTSYEGVATAKVAIMFKKELSDNVASTTFTVPETAGRVLVTGLAESAGYSVSQTPVGSARRVVVTAGGPRVTDSGGVLEIAP